MYKILVVDDELQIRQIIKKYGEFEGYIVDEACDGVEAIKCCEDTQYDLIIMDIMMPNIDGYSAVKMIKNIYDVPVVMLSARGEEYDKIYGFEIGIDDYVVKPFSPKELMMRVAAILKRTKKDHNLQYIKEGLKINYIARKVFIEDEEICLSPKEYDLLVYLVKNEGIALTREQFIREVWGYDFVGDDRTLDTHIKLLRKSLKQYNKWIKTLRGVGYRFETQ